MGPVLKAIGSVAAAVKRAEAGARSARRTAEPRAIASTEVDRAPRHEHGGDELNTSGAHTTSSSVLKYVESCLSAQHAAGEGSPPTDQSLRVEGGADEATTDARTDEARRSTGRRPSARRRPGAARRGEPQAAGRGNRAARRSDVDHRHARAKPPPRFSRFALRREVKSERGRVTTVAEHIGRQYRAQEAAEAT